MGGEERNCFVSETILVSTFPWARSLCPPPARSPPPVASEFCDKTRGCATLLLELGHEIGCSARVDAVSVLLNTAMAAMR